MAVTTEIFEAWRHPVRIIRRKLATGSEAGALAALIGACVLMYVARWPELARQAHLAQMAAREAGRPGDDAETLHALLGINLFALVFLAPLALYAVAYLSRFIARAFGLRLAPLEARMALSWALLSSVPLILLRGLVAGFIGPGPALVATSVLTAALFLYLWITMMWGASRMTAQPGEG